MKILGVDPSLRATGLALVEFPGMKVLFHTWFNLPSAKDVDETWIARNIIRLGIPHWGDADMIGVEHAYLGKGSVRTFYRQGLLIGSLLGSLPEAHDCKVFHINPIQTKMSLGLSGKAKKHEVVRKVEEVSRIEFEEKATQGYREAVSDAIGVATATHILYGQ